MGKIFCVITKTYLLELESKAAEEEELRKKKKLNHTYSLAFKIQFYKSVLEDDSLGFRNTVCLAVEDLAEHYVLYGRHRSVQG